MLIVSCSEVSSSFTVGKYTSKKLSEFERKIEYLFSHQKRISYTVIEFKSDSTFIGNRLNEEIKGNWSLKDNLILLTVLSNSNTVNQMHKIDSTIVYTIDEDCLINKVQVLEDGLREVKVLDIICNLVE